MAVPSSGQVSFSTVSSVFGWGHSGSNYAGRVAYRSSGAFTFPSNNFHMSAFYGTSPTNEWNCACASDCTGACGK